MYNIFIKNFRYFKGELENPFTDSNDRHWWDGEMTLYKQSKGHPQPFFNSLKGLYQPFVKDLPKSEKEPLNEDQKIILCYLIDWTGKWFPYDSFPASSY